VKVAVWASQRQWTPRAARSTVAPGAPGFNYKQVREDGEHQHGSCPARLGVATAWGVRSEASADALRDRAAGLMVALNDAEKKQAKAAAERVG